MIKCLIKALITPVQTQTVKYNKHKCYNLWQYDNENISVTAVMKLT